MNKHDIFKDDRDRLKFRDVVALTFSAYKILLPYVALTAGALIAAGLIISMYLR